MVSDRVFANLATRAEAKMKSLPPIARNTFSSLMVILGQCDGRSFGRYKWARRNWRRLENKYNIKISEDEVAVWNLRKACL